MDIPNTSNVSDHDVDDLLQKLAKLESTQDMLEHILNTGIPEDVDAQALLNQFSIDDSIHAKNRGDGEDQSDRSVASEIASIQKLIDADLSVSFFSEVAGGNQTEIPVSDNADIQQTNSKTERGVDDVLKEYEEFERSLSQVSGVDDSFRSDIGSLPSFSTQPNKQPVSSLSSTVPVIKPPVLKSVVPAVVQSAPSKPASDSEATPDSTQGVAPADTNPAESQPPPEMFAPPLVQSQVGSKSPSLGSARTRPLTTSSGPKKTSHSNKNDHATKSSRIEHSQSTHGMKTQTSSHSARPAASSTATSCRENNTQDAFKPRNRRMVSPRKPVHPNQPPSFSAADMPGKSTMGGAGEEYHVTHHHYPQNQVNEEANNLIASEALKTIEKLNAMVARQESLLEAYSKDNDMLWTQLREAKAATNEKEQEFQDVINSLKAEVSTLKLNRLVVNSPRQKPSLANKDELQRLREDSELKSQQVLELRREILLLQSKLTGMQKSGPSKQKQNPAVNIVVQEKEKEYQKQINALNKQVRTLQKILYSKDQTAPPVQPSGSNVSQKQSQSARSRPLMNRALSSDAGFKGNANVQNLVRGASTSGVDAARVLMKRSGSSPIKNVNMNSGDILQASLNCIEQEREEYENCIAEKDKLIFEKETMIINLKDQIESLKRQLPDDCDLIEPGLTDELRSRIITQNKVIQQLKEHLSTYKELEAENIVLREERSILETQIIELRRKVDFAQSLKKPENEVLCLLSEKVDELNSRYYHRERQLDSLLSRLSLKTTSSVPGGMGVGGVLSSSSSNGSNSSSGSVGISTRPLTLSSPRRNIVLDQFNNNNGSLGKVRCGASSTEIIPTDILHMADFSPSASFQYDVPEM